MGQKRFLDTGKCILAGCVLVGILWLVILSNNDLSMFWKVFSCSFVFVCFAVVSQFFSDCVNADKVVNKRNIKLWLKRGCKF